MYRRGLGNNDARQTPLFANAVTEIWKHPSPLGVVGAGIALQAPRYSENCAQYVLPFTSVAHTSSYQAVLKSAVIHILDPFPPEPASAFPGQFQIIPSTGGGQFRFTPSMLENRFEDELVYWPSAEHKEPLLDSTC